MSLFGEGEDLEMADFMMTLWGNITNRDVWDFWPDVDPVEPITGKKGYLDNSPLFRYLTNVFEQHNNTVKKRAFASAVDSDSGTYVPFSLYDEPGANKTSIEFKVSAVVASASIPFVFPPREMTYEGKLMNFMDGGTVWNNNMMTAINECMKLEGVANEE